MATITNYTTLVQACVDSAEDDSAEFSAYVPVAIDAAELRMTRELDTYGLTVQTTVTAIASSPFVTKPAGYRVGHQLVYVDPVSQRSRLLKKKSNDYLSEYWPQPTSVGTVVYYADADNETFKIAPCAANQSLIVVECERRPTPLSTSNATNYFTDFCSDALFHATMMEMSSWMRNQELFVYHKTFYDGARTAINNEGKRARKDDGVADNAPSQQNTLTGE